MEDDQEQNEDSNDNLVHTESTTEETRNDVRDRLQSIVVFHPGSQNLRYGRASEITPMTIPHVIARLYEKRDGSNLPPVLPPQEAEEGEEGLRAILKDLPRFRKPLAEDGERFDQSNCTETLKPEEDADFTWTDVGHNPQHLVGMEALRIPPNREDYEIRYPIRRGRLNVTEDYPLQVVLGDIYTIWLHALETVGIVKKDLFQYSVVLVIPDLFDRNDVRELISLLLNQFSFRSILINQESACAAFGHGLSTACVVDIGDQKTTVACVDEAMVLPTTRYYMNYGGKDISRFLLRLLQASTRHYFPYKKCNINNPQDESIISELKKESCHLEKHNHRTQIFSFRVRSPERPTILYHINVSDALLIAPMGLFHPRALAPLEPIPDWDSSLDYSIYSEELNSDLVPLTRAQPGKDKIVQDVVGLDSAILASLSQIQNKKDLKRKLLSSVILVGGSSQFTGLREILEEKLMGSIPTEWEIERVELLAHRRKDKELNPCFLSWRGGAILASLDSTKEMWISCTEWNTYGERYIHERAPFVFLAPKSITATPAAGKFERAVCG